MRFAACLFTAGALALPAFAQDSVSTSSCLPGDAVNAWDATEQCNNYIVDLSALTTSWGTRFGIAPIVKTSKMSSANFNALNSTQAISARQKVDTSFASPSYSLWTTAGAGINSTFNTPGTPVNTSGFAGHQFAVALAEFGTTDAPDSKSYNAIVGALVNLQPNNPGRLYVKRVTAALNSCDQTSNLAQFGLGSVDEAGNLHFRADGGSAGAPTSAGCGLTNFTATPTDANIFRVRLAGRNCGVKNVISRDWIAGGQFDKPATDWLVRDSATNHSTPGIMPTSTTFGAPLYLGANFSTTTGYSRGSAFGGITADNSHLAAGIGAQRGNLAYTVENCASLASTHGIGAVLGKVGAAAKTKALNVFGLNVTGGVTGAAYMELPALVVDNSTGYTNDDIFGGVLGAGWGAGDEFDHYHDQTGFRGGNGPVALGVDQSGNLLAAAQVAAGFGPSAPPINWDYNYIAVARRNCQNGTVQWTMAGYNDDANGSNIGKPILDGPGGNIIGRMCLLGNVTGGSPVGPSVSAPMIDSVGNVWFMSAFVHIDENGSTVDPDSGLIRAVYNPTNFSYELELVVSTGRTFLGKNSNTRWQLSFLNIADGNSVDSATAWSGNISQGAHLNMDPTSFPTKSAETLGGLVIGAEITYDYDGDGTYEGCTGANPGPNDQNYRALLYIAPTSLPCDPCDANCDGSVNLFDIDPFVSILSGEEGCGPCTGDANYDGSINLFDIDPFVGCLSG